MQSALTTSKTTPFQLDYGRELEQEIERLLAAFAQHNLSSAPYAPRWLAVKLLEQDPEIVARYAGQPAAAPVLELAKQRNQFLQEFFGDDVDLYAADQRYGFINGVVRQVLRRPQLDRLTFTERIDNIVTHKWLGLPVFFAVMYLMFRLVIDVSAPFLDWTDALVNVHFAGMLTALLQWLNAPDWLLSLAIDGVVAGVGGILVFVPGLVVLYFFLALLEDSGYMARAAFVMDRFMRLVGLHGKAFIPMILGFGCAVPAIYATRTIPSYRDRILTTLLVPLMSCSARLPVYVVFGLAFFGSSAGTVIWGLYALGIVVAMLAGALFTRTLLKPDASSAFVLELPPYRRPSRRSVFIHTWTNTREFVYKAGTMIFALSIVMWFLLNLPWGVENARDSYFGKTSALLAPVFRPLGFGEWDTAGALVTGFVAKEVVVSTMSQIYAGDTRAAEQAAHHPTVLEGMAEIATGFITATLDAGRILLSIVPGVDLLPAEPQIEDMVLTTALRERFTPLSAFAFLVFVLLYVPCVSTLGAIKHEFGTSWAVFSGVYQTAAAWLIAFLIYQGGLLLGLG
ncbi:MAG: hypothetical protein OHK0052_14100 [Anaerolineales bacterium]